LKKIFLVFLFCLSLNANEYDGLLDGFDESSNDIQIKQEQSNLSGSFSLFSSYNYKSKQSNHKGLSSLQSALELSFEDEYKDIKYKGTLNSYYDLFYTLRDSSYTKEYKDQRKDFEIKELYFMGSLNDNFDYKIGRQIVTWGKSDNIIITDIINPQDKRKLALSEIKDLKLNQTMSKFDYYMDNNSLSLIAIHENRVSKKAPYGSDFNFANRSINQNKPSHTLADTSYALSFNHIGNGFDLALYFANKYDEKGYLYNGIREYDKFKMYGLSTNLARGNFLFKAEAGYFTNVRYNNLKDSKNRFDVMLGFEYKGFKDTTVSFEHAIKKIYDYNTAIAFGVEGQKEYERQSVIRLNKDFFNAKLHFTYLLSMLNEYTDGFHKSFVDYEYSDNIVLSVGIIDYFGDENLKFQNLEDNDRVFASFKYSF